MKRRNNLHQNRHPFDACPFEAFEYGSWQAVECLKIRNGSITMLLVDGENFIEENVTISNLRIRSRKATLMDCTCFLRPGLDVCVLSTTQFGGNSGEEENQEPVWLDAKITSIERKPHESKCDCQFYVKLYVTQGALGMANRILSKDIVMVQIDHIAILQKLEWKPCENEHYRWDFSEDCSSLQKFKLFTGKFSSDISWLVVSSILKNIDFDVRSVQNKLVYQILDVDSEDTLKAVNFKVENDISVSTVVPFTLKDSCTPEKENDCGIHEDEPISEYDLMGLRRSKRRFVQPERYLGCDDLPEVDIEGLRIGGFTKQKWEYEEMPLALSIQADHAYQLDEYSDLEEKIHTYKKYSQRDLSGSHRKNKSGEVQSAVSNRRGKDHLQLAIVPVSDEADQTAYNEDLNDDEVPDNDGEIGEIVSKYIYVNGMHSVHKKTNSGVNLGGAEGGWDTKNSYEKYRRRRGFYTMRVKKDVFKKHNTEIDYTGVKGGWQWGHLRGKGCGRKKKTMFSEKEDFYDMGVNRKSAFTATLYKEMIRKCLENIKSSVHKEQPLIIDQWNEFQAEKFRNERDGSEKPSMTEEENSELEMLWKEMELCMASTYILDDMEGCNVEVPPEITQNGNKYGGQFCKHEYKLNEEIGIICQLCGYVSTEIKDVSPTFLQSTAGWSQNKGLRNEDDSERKPDEDMGLDFLSIPAASNIPLSEKEDNVWALIPELKRKLRLHQKRAFEFLWRNIAGSLVPARMEAAAKKRGGCVISHSPGAGKTLLIIAFLVSYLKLFPGSRPLVLAPKTTLYTWYKEIIKWEIPIPVYQIHGGQTYRGEVLRQKLRISPGTPKPNQDVMHVVDCLEKIQKWLAHPSMLLMGYTSFLTLTREDSKFAHRQYMGTVLRQCPGILVLDEGHNPRSTKSRLRKALMKVETGLRVLLSGTLFQNNFGEYFNTLTLARPKFVNEVLKKLDPKFKRRKKGRTRFSLENRARKFFIDKISKKIDSNEAEERLEGLNMLKKLTNFFIDVYEGGSSDNLPGLQCYTLMMKSTPYQQELLIKLQNQRPQYKGFPLELELLITLGSIHPWLIRTTTCASQYFSMKILDDLDKYKFDLKFGSKVRFVMSLIPRCIIRKEKVLIFCHNIAPINLFLEIFEMFYGWQKGEEVLVLQGDLELFERGRVMDKFEEPGGASRVMLASITACAEGISLTAASRVILLDSEWNPSKSKQAIARAFRPGQAKVVYVYQLLATGTLEEEKHSRTTWKEWVSSMIFSEELVEDPSHWQAEKIEDDILREIVEEDRATLFHMIMKNEKASNSVMRSDK
ncbi:Thymine dioxygenase [Bertholletia excelsa]